MHIRLDAVMKGCSSPSRLSPIGLWYYVPWTITASCVLLVVGGIFFLVNSGKSANSVDEVLDLIGAR